MFRARPPRRDWRGGLEAIALSVGLGVAVLFALVVGNNVPWLAVLSEHRWAVVAERRSSAGVSLLWRPARVSIRW